MKNILFLHAGSEMYGADKILLELVTGIDSKKFHPIVVLPGKGILEKKLVENGVEVHVVSYPILRRKYFNFLGIYRYMIEYRKKSLEIRRLLSGRRIDLIHVNTTAVLEGIYLKKRLGIPLIWHVHEIIMSPRIVHYVISFLLGRYADKIVAVSKAVQKHLLNTKLIKKSKVQVIHNGVSSQNRTNAELDYLLKEFNVSNKTVRVGMIGRVNSWKGQKDFVRAMEPILEKNRNIHAFLIGGVFKGEEWRYTELSKYISMQTAASQYTLTGYRNDADYIMNLFDVFVIPSIRPDPLPTVVLEAMAAGKPVVGYCHGGVTEMVESGENGYLVSPGLVKELSEKISILVNSEDLRKKFGDCSIRRQQRFFSKKSFYHNFENLYNSL